MAKKVGQFLTKKVVLIILVAVVAAGGIIWAIVANAQPKFRSGITTVPAAEYVSGNGTSSVMVDNYLYFVGDSIATSSIAYGDNEYYADGKMPDTGIYRVKIANGQPVVTYEYDNTSTNDAGEKITLAEGDEGYNTNVVGVNDWDNIGKKGNGIEAVVPKIAGHEKTALWVFGKYLIYTSPHNRYDNRGNLLSDYLDFYRVDLDGKNHTLIYTSESNDLTTDNFTVWANATDNIYLLIYETVDSTTSVKKINVKTKKVTVLDSDVGNVVLPNATQYRTKNHPNETLDKVYGGVMGYVYYTKEHDTDYTSIYGNELWYCPINDGEPTRIASNGTSEEGTTFTPLAVTPLQNGDAQFVYSTVVKNSTVTTKLPRLYVMTNQTMTDYRFDSAQTDDGWGLQEDDEIEIYANGFCTINGTLWHYVINDNVIDQDASKNLGLSIDDVLAVIDNTAYVQIDTTVEKVTANGTATPIALGGGTTTDDTTDEEDTTTAVNDTTDQPTLPMAVLYHPYGETGDHMIFVHDTAGLRVANADGQVYYVKFKTA
ncbi:MAG: hypothetical protein NC133_02300 [Prevotella sp.]|nr:hypothetical protein [Prevotella sp.]